MFLLFMLLGGKGGQRERKSRSPWIICSCLRVLWLWYEFPVRFKMQGAFLNSRAFVLLVKII